MAGVGALLLLAGCGGAPGASPADSARIRARNDAREIINRPWPDSLSRAEAVQELKDSARVDYQREGRPELAAPYDSTLSRTIKTVLKN